jgi:hypothetical protein
MLANADAHWKTGVGPGEVRELCRLDDVPTSQGSGRACLLAASSEPAAMQQHPEGTRMSARAYHGKTQSVFLSNSSGVACILKLARTIADPSTPQGRPGRQRRDPDGASFGFAQDRLGGGDSVSAATTNIAVVVAFGLSRGLGWGAAGIWWGADPGQPGQRLPARAVVPAQALEAHRRVTLCVMFAIDLSPLGHKAVTRARYNGGESIAHKEA